jgi:hypothetical protein
MKLKCSQLTLLLALIPTYVLAQGASLSPSGANPKFGSAASLAFARYVASIDPCDPFTQAGPVAIMIEGSLPGLYKTSAVLAIRQPGESGRPEHQVLHIEGDAIVIQELIVPYLRAVTDVDDQPLASVAITPANYKFRYVGEVGNGDMLTHVFEITPKKKRDGLLQGRLWIHALSGAAVRQTGHSVKPPSAAIRRIEVVRETQFVDGLPCIRITHVTVETGRVGRGELTITEYRLFTAGEQAPSPSLGPNAVIR